MPLNRQNADQGGSAEGFVSGVPRKVAVVGNVVKFPNEGRIVRFGRVDAIEPATIIILPVVRIERCADIAEHAEPRRHPPADSRRRRSIRRR